MHKLLFLKGKELSNVYKEYIHIQGAPRPIFHKPYYCLPDRHFTTMFLSQAKTSVRKVKGVPDIYPQREANFYTKLEEVPIPWLKGSKVTEIFELYKVATNKRAGYCIQFEFGHNIVGYQDVGGGIEIIIDADLKALGYRKEVVVDDFGFRYRV